MPTANFNHYFGEVYCKKHYITDTVQHNVNSYNSSMQIPTD